MNKLTVYFELIRSIPRYYGSGRYKMTGNSDYKSFGGVLSNIGEDERQSFIGNTWSWEFGNGNWIFTPHASRSTPLRWWTPYH